jgi:hypothetical protein
MSAVHRRLRMTFSAGRSLSVVTVIGALVASMGMAAADPSATAAPPEWQTITATSADDFVNSAGINVHMNNADTGYGDENRTLALIHNLGVRHVRDGLQPHDPDVFAALRLFRDNGIDSVLIAGGSFDKPDSTATIAGGIDALTDPEKLRGVASGIEGTNEPDCDGLPDDTKPRQRQLASMVNAEPELADIPVLTPGWCRQSASIIDYGSDGNASDLWNVHPYPGEVMPEADQPDSRPDFDATAQGQVEAAQKAEDQPVWATETGYNNALNNPEDGAIPISEKAAGQYIPRIFLENARLGIDRTYLYELYDERPDPALTDPEQSFGLIRYDGSTKPAYRSLQAMFTTLADPGEPVAARDIRVGITQAPQDLRHLALSRRDGSVDLVLWRAASVWNTTTDADIAVKPARVMLTMPAAVPASTVTIASGSARTSLGSGTRFDLTVGPSPIIVRLGASRGTSAVQQLPLPEPETAELSTPGRPTFSNIRAQSTSLKWNESTGSGGLNTYVVFRDGKAIARTTEPRYTDRSLSPEKTYRYQIRAIDHTGGMTPFSRIATVITPPAQR